MLWASSKTGGPDHTGHRQTAKWRGFTAPWPTNGPTHGSTAATPNAASNSRPGLYTYNHHRGHTALGGQRPTTRVPDLSGHYS